MASEGIALTVPVAGWLSHRQAGLLGLTWAALDAGTVQTRNTARSVPVDPGADPEVASEIAAERTRSTGGTVSLGPEFASKIAAERARQWLNERMTLLGG